VVLQCPCALVRTDALFGEKEKEGTWGEERCGDVCVCEDRKLFDREERKAASTPIIKGVVKGVVNGVVAPQEV
jgi:hypothetical protein